MNASVQRPPIVVVALGDPKYHDDGLATRVLGRVRTLVGEIGVARARVPKGPGRRAPSGTASTALASPGSVVEWVEGGADPRQLDTILIDRRRVVLLDAVNLGGRAGSVYHWHLRCDPGHRLSQILHYNGRPVLGFQHLALWLEDDLPEHGTDLIGIQACDFSSGEGLSRPVRRLLPSICAQVTGILVRVLEDEGW